MLITDEKQLKDLETRSWQGIPGIAVLEGGRLFAAFYTGGVSEGAGNYCLLYYSDDGAATWKIGAAACADDRAARCYDPVLWVDPLKRLWFIWSAMPSFTVRAAVCGDPAGRALAFMRERVIGYDVMMNKPIVTDADRWLFPLSVWTREVYQNGVAAIFNVETRRRERKAFVFETRDCGESFRRLGGADGQDRSVDENALLALKDGALAMYTRTNYGIGKAVSPDGGLTWSEIRDSGIPGPNSRFHISRLRSGNILLVNHAGFSGRNRLTAFISEDETESWKGGLLLDKRRDVSYPDAAQDKNGHIYIIYDRERGSFGHLRDHAKEILLAKVTERDILAGKLLSGGSFLKRIVSKLS
ncbi:MAG: glycoside hydrolase [Clostridiales bacterium]|jgi:hypothetical protein|nr:glycoside hydrolase [Clostridiales bacterium]